MLTDEGLMRREVHQQLVPTLRSDIAPGREDLDPWTRRLVSECKAMLSIVLPLEPQEVQFLDHLNQRGEIRAELLTDVAGLKETIRTHPGLQWKALNVRRRP